MCEAVQQYNATCETDVEVIKATYTWSISNFSFLTAHSERKIKSSIFTMGEGGQFKWRMRLYPNGCEEGTEGTHISLFLQMVSPTTEEIPAKFDFAIIKADGQKHMLASHKIRKYTQWKSLGYHELIDRSQLLDARSGMMLDDCLKLVCEVSVYTGKRTNLTTVIVSELSGKVVKNLVRNMGSLLESQRYSDVTLVAGGGRIPAHKAVLSARSPVFAAMFEHDMQEASLNEVVIEDVERDVLEQLVRFLYTGKPEKLETLAAGLLAAADKYAIDDLKLICERCIAKSLSVENALNVVLLADRHNAQTLKEQALAYQDANSQKILRNFTSAMLNPEEKLFNPLKMYFRKQP